jgi:Heliorhodopsin
MTNLTQLQQKSLFNWNLAMAFLHFIQAIIMFFLSTEVLYKTFVTLPAANGRGFPIPLQNELFLEFNLGQTISFFLFASAIAHFVTILPGVHSWYLKNLAREMNLIRWWEYAFSSSVMIVVIAALCGINDAFILGLLFSINACMNLFGAVMEKHNSALKELKGREYKTDWTAYIYGVFAGIIPWIVMGAYFFTALDVAGDRVPDFVYWTFGILFVFFNLFAINMFVQYQKLGPWKEYLFGEKAYIILSLAAKTTLAWLIWGGTLRG